VDRFAVVVLLFLFAAWLVNALRGQGRAWVRSKLTGRTA
jgi:hypothetical protein